VAHTSLSEVSIPRKVLRGGVWGGVAAASIIPRGASIDVATCALSQRTGIGPRLIPPARGENRNWRPFRFPRPRPSPVARRKSLAKKI
jgi:hypothetical protein